MLNYHELQEHIQDFFVAIGANAGADYDHIEQLNNDEILKQQGDINTPQPHHSSSQDVAAPFPNEEGTLKH
ncbi:MAG: hypothetical protein COB51_02615 [Moraxellaceae bacterium]|nr:MAG: hypothetical protein COB51_02615 [Moraxellaceae bacterium]